MKRKVFSVTILIIDHDEVGSDEIVSLIENARYPNRCVSPVVISYREAEVDWSDDHPLNKSSPAKLRVEHHSLFCGKTVEQMCRNLLTRAINDSLVTPFPDATDTPQSLSSGDLAGMANLLSDYLEGG